LDIHLNDRAYWSSIPSRVWSCSLGGYPVLKKRLSYHEQSILDRPLTPEEVREFRDIARRIAAILLIGPALDANYQAVTPILFDWSTVSRKPSE
jgi:hypothetical protein